MKILWQQATEKTATVTIFKNHAFFSNQKGLIKRIKIGDHGSKNIWQKQTEILPMKIINHIDKLWIFSQYGNVITLSLKTGRIESSTHISNESISCVADHFNGHWIFSNMNGTISAFNHESKRVIWRSETLSDGVISSLSFIDNILFVANQRGEIWQLNPLNGKIIDHHNTGIPIGSPIMKYKTNLVIWGGEGKITRYNLVDKKIKSPSIPGDCWIRCGTPWKNGYFFGDDCGNIIYRNK